MARIKRSSSGDLDFTMNYDWVSSSEKYLLTDTRSQNWSNREKLLSNWWGPIWISLLSKKIKDCHFKSGLSKHESGYWFGLMKLNSFLLWWPCDRKNLSIKMTFELHKYVISPLGFHFIKHVSRNNIWIWNCKTLNARFKINNSL